MSLDRVMETKIRVIERMPRAASSTTDATCVDEY